ncbi:MAG: hypothetical protein ACM3ZA_05860 [Bacillota bacterium]
MTSVEELRKLLDSGVEISEADLIRLGVVRVVDDLTFQRNRLIEFERKYHIETLEFYRSFRENYFDYSAQVPKFDALEWVHRYERFLDAGGDPFTLPPAGTAGSPSRGQASNNDKHEAGASAPASLRP